jgi:hypothetical protein
MMFTIYPPEFEDVRGQRLGQLGEGKNQGKTSRDAAGVRVREEERAATM